MTMPPSPLPASMLPELDRAYSSRWESLLAVDEMVADVMAALEKKNAMKDTYVIYTSDNGYHVGELEVGTDTYIFINLILFHYLQ